MTTSESPTLVIGQGPAAEAVAGRLRATTVLAQDAATGAGLPERLAALIIVAPPASPPALFEDIDDARLDGHLAQFTDVFAALGHALGRLEDNGAVLLIGDRGYLGAWGAADACAFSGAYAALMRCVILEGHKAGHRANTLALDMDEDGAPLESAELARLANQLIAPEGEVINGAILLANRGRSLRMREARDRRAALAPTQGSPS